MTPPPSDPKSTPPAPSSSEPAAAEPESPAAYEPPTISELGSVRELTQGFTADEQPDNEAMMGSAV
jgi:hypothetical protein